MCQSQYWRLHMSCLTTHFSAICLGMTLFYPSTAFADINSGDYGFYLSAEVTSWLASFAGLFAVPGALITAPIMDKFGRRTALILNTVLFTVGWLLNVLTFNVATLAVSRAILGLTIGMEYSTIFVYLSEIAPKNMRGTLTGIFTVFACLGGFLINLVGAFYNWRWMAVAALASIALASFFVPFLYETPRYLLHQCEYVEALETVQFLWNVPGPDALAKELNEIEMHVEVTTRLSFRAGVRKLLKPPLSRPFAITQLLMLFQQFAGNAYISTYTVAIFQQAGADLQIDYQLFTEPKYQSCVVTFGYVIGGAASAFFIDKIGRRSLLISSGSVVALSMTALGLYYYLQSTNVRAVNEYLYWLPLNCLLLYVLGFSFAYGSIPFLMVSELFPLQVRGVANALGSLNHNLCYFLVLKIFPSLTVLPNYGIFWIYACVAFISVVFVYFFVPETRGRSLEEIEDDWRVPPLYVNGREA